MNLKQLSDILGISQTTISRALNGYPEVNKDTKRRVEEAAKKYGYAPSSIARRLAGKKVEAVGVIYPFDRSLRSSPVFLEMVRMLTTRLREEKIDLFIIPGSAEEEIELYDRMVTGGRVDSFVVVATKRDDPRIRWLLDRKIPFVAHGRSQVEGEYSWYDVDNRGGMKKAADTLISMGHRKLALINPGDEFNFAFDRKMGLLESIEEHGDKVDQPLILEGVLDEDAGRDLAFKALSGPEDSRPTAFLCSSMLNAMGVAAAIEDKGLEVGRDVSVIAWDDGVSDISAPEMSVIDAPIGQSGERMGELMLNLLRKDEKEVYNELQEAKVILKKSVGPLETVNA